MSAGSRPFPQTLPLVSHPEQSEGSRLVHGDSSASPQNDKCASPEGEGFPPSPNETLISKSLELLKHLTEINAVKDCLRHFSPGRVRGWRRWLSGIHDKGRDHDGSLGAVRMELIAHRV